MRLAATLMLGALALCSAEAEGGFVAGSFVRPIDPVEGERVLFLGRLCQGNSPAPLEEASAYVDGDMLTFELLFEGGLFAVPWCDSGTALSPRLRAGNISAQYWMGVSWQSPEYTALPPLNVRAASAINPRYPSLRGKWYGASPGNTTLRIDQRKERISLSWLVPDAFVRGRESRPRMVEFTVPDGRWVEPSRFRGLMYRPGLNSRHAPQADQPQGVLELVVLGPSAARLDATFILHSQMPIKTVSQALSRVSY